MAKAKKTTSANSTPQPKDWRAPGVADKTFVFGGRDNYKKRRMVQRIEAEGGRIADDLAANVDYLVLAGTGSAGIEKKAQALIAKGSSIRILDESAFDDLFTVTRDEFLEMARDESAQPRLARLESAPDDLRDADLRNAFLKDVHLNGSKLDGSDLSGAKLAGANLPDVKQAKFVGADLSGCYLDEFEDCDFSKSKLANIHMWAGGFTRCKLDGADLTDAHVEKAIACSFRDAVAAGITIEGDAGKSDFTGADLTGSTWHEAKAGGAVFRNAKLIRAKMCGLDLRKCDLKKSLLTEAILADADLSGAEVEGADFTGAILLGAKLGDLKGKPRGLDPNAAAVPPAAAKLDKTLKNKVSSLKGTLTVGGKAFAWRTYSKYRGGFHLWFEATPEVDVEVPSLGYALAILLARNGAADLDPADLTVKPASGAKAGDIKDAVMTAWYGITGGTPPTAEELKRRAKARRDAAAAQRDTILAELRGGPKGIKAFNARGAGELGAVNLKNIDLSGAKLDGVRFHGLDLSGSNFAGASLSGAELNDTNFRKANFNKAKLGKLKCGEFDDFTEADLTDADLRGGELGGANFAKAILCNAKLTGANLEDCGFEGADLTGADLTDAKVSEARYNNATKLPDGFVPGDEMTWTGVGLPPHKRVSIASAAAVPAGGSTPVAGAATPASAPAAGGAPMDPTKFVELLKTGVDPSKLAKSLSMLKADKFQLFVDTSDTRLAGVVKSQTDASLVYSCSLDSHGKFGCCTQNLNICGGLRGSLCKHLLVLIVGLVKADKFKPESVIEWIAASQGRKPELDKDAMSDIFLRYKGAEAGEVDWRPVETVPEDYYTL